MVNGEEKQEKIRIVNKGENILNVKISQELLGDFVKITEKSFSLKPDEYKDINLVISSREMSDAYVGRIIINGNEVTKVVNVIIEVYEDMFEFRTVLLREVFSLHETLIKFV